MNLHEWITQRVNTAADEAHEAAGGAGSEHWTVGEEADCKCCFHLRTDSGGLLCTPDSRYVDFMAAHDPATVLRRCEADRRVLARHCQDVSPGNWHHSAACAGCGVGGDCDDPVTEDINECPELLDLAHAHGISAEELAALDPPQTTPRPPARPMPVRARMTAEQVPAALRGTHH